ncbi:MAG: ATP-grasp domain-containing protein [Clostridiales bacterium]|nr:ATP-grasp domain-containing protein [Clostridiales bacterium]
MQLKHRKVLIIGAGPTVVGRSTEYDYAAAQTCLALKEEGIKVIILNPNAATMHTNKEFADSVYLEPLTVEVLEKVIKKERPDAILSNLGGLSALDLINQEKVAEILEEFDVKLLPFGLEVIRQTTTTQGLKEFLADISEPFIKSYHISNVDEATDLSQKLDFPLVVKAGLESERLPASFCANEKELKSTLEELLKNQERYTYALEKSIIGWKEVEFELVRDTDGQVYIVSNLENIDPVGVHAGDSVAVTPAKTISSALNKLMAKSVENIANKLGLIGSCSIKFAIRPNSTDEFVVLGITPGFNRNSALISKVTGYPIARVSAKLILGKKLKEIHLDVKSNPLQNSGPCAVRFPKWSFDKLGSFKRKTSSVMQATGEIVALGSNFESAFMKAVRSVNNKNLTPTLSHLADLADSEILSLLEETGEDKIFVVYEAVKRQFDKTQILKLSGIDIWFLEKFARLSEMENALKFSLDENLYIEAKSLGFLDEAILMLNPLSTFTPAPPSYKSVKPVKKLIGSNKPYLFSTYNLSKEEEHSEIKNSTINKVLVVGAGPLSAGQAGELDYCNAQSMACLKKLGFEIVLLNNNPASVSTGSGFSDKVYIEPITNEDFKNILEQEKPGYVLAQFAGESSLEITRIAEESGVRVLGSSSEVEAIVNNRDKLKRRITNLGLKKLDKGLHKAVAFELAVISDGNDVIVPGISENIEKYLINAGDSIAVYPSISLNQRAKDSALDCAKKIALELGIKGIFNLQLALFEQEVYVLSVSTKAMHNVPMFSKATGFPLIKTAVNCMLGKTVEKMDLPVGLLKESEYKYVRVPVFSFDKISGVDSQLGSTMKSTGEVLAFAPTFEDALYKGLIASGMQIKNKGNVIITVRNSDKEEVIEIAEKFAQLGFNLYATSGTAYKLNSNWVATNYLRKIHEGSPNILDLIYEKKVVYVVSTSEENRISMGDDVLIRRKALENKIPTLTTMETARALLRCLSLKRVLGDLDIMDIMKVKE